MPLTAKQRKRSVRIPINRTNPQEAEAVIRRYLQQNYGGSDHIEPYQHSNGRGHLVVVMKGRDMVLKLCQDNPHSTSGLKFRASDNSINDHNSSNVLSSNSGQQKEIETECARILAILPYLGQLPSLISQMEHTFRSLSLSHEDHQVRQDFMNRLQVKFTNVLRDKTSCCFLYAFGSSVNGLGMKNCDLDLVLTTNGNIQSMWPEPLPNQRMLIMTLKNLMYQEQRNFGITNIVPILSARIPLIKFRHTPTNIDCDISFNKRLGVLNSLLIAAVMEFSESAKLLAFTIRLWGKRKTFVGGGGAKLNSYTITLMVIFYLQRVDVLPALAMLKHPENTIFDRSEGESFFAQRSDFDQFRGKMVNMSQDALLRGFLEYYLRFPFENNIISVLHGKPIAVEDDPLFNVKLINVQDPFEMHYNTAKGVQQPMKRWFRKCLCDAWCNKAILCEPNHSNGQPWGLQFLFQSPSATTESKKHKSSTAAGERGSDDSFGVITLDVPKHIRERPTITYAKVCAEVLNVLRLTYNMCLEIPHSAHPMYETLRHFHTGMSTSSTSQSEVVNLTGDTNYHVTDCATSSTSGVATGRIPMELYLPYTIQVRTHWRLLKDCSMLAADTFNYDSYINDMRECSSHTDRSRPCDFTVSLQPHDGIFERIDLELKDINTNHLHAIRQHLSKVLPLAIHKLH